MRIASAAARGPRSTTPTTLFLVLSGRLTIRMRDGDVEFGPGQMFVVPVGVEHQPYSETGAELLLIEPSGTPNTGDAATAADQVEI